MTHTKKALLIATAFELFASRGFAETSVDEIAAVAGVSRSTFFRYFPTKEDVVFPDHDALIPQIEQRLATATSTTWQATLRQATRAVLDYYVSEADVARTRFRLTSSVPTLRDREVTSVHRYQRLFTRFVSSWLDGEGMPSLRSEILAAKVITANNHLLRSWLRGDVADPYAEFDVAMDEAFSDPGRPSRTDGHTIVIHSQGSDIERTLNAVREALSTEALSE